MPAYATREDLEMYGLPETVVGKFDDATIEAVLEAASDEADGYLDSVFTLPLVEWPAVLTKKICALAAWDLMSSHGFNPARGGDEVLERRNNAAIEWLQRVAGGLVTLQDVVDSSEPDDSDESAISVITDPKRGWGPFV